MGKKVMSDFVIESKSHCFLCLEKIPPGIHIQDQGKPQLPTVHSLQYLSRFLGMDMRKVFTDSEKGDIPPHLLTKVERSILKSHLCEECASMNGYFSKMCKRLEHIEMEVMHSLENIHRRLLKPGSITAHFGKPEDSKEESEHEWVAKLDILNILRKDAIHKCSVKLKTTRPKAKVQSLTGRDILKEKRKYIHSSRISFKERTALPLSSLQQNFSKDATHEPIFSQAGIKTELDESSHSDIDSDHHDFDIETGSPPSSDSWQGSALPTVKRESEQFQVRNEGRQHRRKQRRRDPAILNNVERIKLGEKCSSQSKFRCKLCSRIFAKESNTIRHIECIHIVEKQMSPHYRIKRHRCHLCAKGFSRKGHLQQHLLVHNRTRTRFANRQRQRQNQQRSVGESVEVIRTTRNPSSRRKFRCKLCTRMFSDQSNTVRHIKSVHLKERRFQCPKCSRAFSSNQTLESHVLVHHSIFGSNQHERVGSSQRMDYAQRRY